MKLLRAGILACVLACGASAPLAQGASAAHPPTHYLRIGDYDAARARLRELVAGRPDAALHLAYLEAQIRLRQNDPDDAARIFREILAVAPDFEPARRELALVLAHRGDRAGAVFHAERLIAQTSDERLRADLQNYILSSGQTRPRGMALRFSITPSSNLNKGSEQSVVMIGGLPFVVDAGSRAEKGVAVNLGATAWNRWSLAERWAATLSASVDTKAFSTGQEPETLAALRLDLVHQSARSRISFGPVVDVMLIGDEVMRKRFGMSAAVHYALSRRDAVNASLRFDRQLYPMSPFRDGTRLIGQLGWSRALSTRTRLSLSLPFERETTNRAHLDHVELGLRVGLEHEWRNGLHTDVFAAVARDSYRGDFPGMRAARRDVTLSVGIALRHRDLAIGRYTPELSYTFTRSRSNVGFYDYDSHDLGLGLSMRF